MNSPTAFWSEVAPGPFAAWLERAIVGTLFLFAFAVPVSIAGTQIAWGLGIVFWLVRLLIWPRPRLFRTPVDYALLGFFVLSGISSVLSYEPFTSIPKLRAATLFTIVYLFAESVRSIRIFRALLITLTAAAVVSALFTFGQAVIGRGIKVQDVQANSPLKASSFSPERLHNQPTPIQSGDTIETVDGVRISSAEELIAALDRPPTHKPAQVTIYRVEWNPTLQLPRGGLLPGLTAEERLGIGSWSRGRERRAVGFFSHWTTYGEALQLLASLVLGLLVALPHKRNKWGILLAVTLAMLGAALMLTIVRASWLSFLISATLIALLGLRWRALAVVGLCALPLVFAGLFLLQQRRNVGFFDPKDDSIRWRQTVQREGLRLLVSNPRHLLFGVGIDSIKAHWREWNLFDQGRRPKGHMHSDYLQIALERGLPALIAWLALMAIYARRLWRLQSRLSKESWIEKGFALGALGGLLGFMTSGIVHYNWGDSEVVMIFYMIMGMGLALDRLSKLTKEDAEKPIR